MSYLSPLRLHFFGQFQADPSTVNNDVRHFNNDTFQPQFKLPQSGSAMNGWWEPEGSGAWRLVGCTVTTVCYGDGTTSQTDPVVGLGIADANARVAGKIVDLDPQQQMVSEIWGLIVRLTDGTTDSFAGNFEVASFTDIWNRALAGGGDLTMGAFWQSVITNLTWGDTSGSRFLEELKAASPDQLSIKLNVDGYNMDSTKPTFTLGRLSGTIGPSSGNEPKHFVIGRQLLPTPSSPLNFLQAKIDSVNKQVLADFGNALPTTTAGGPFAPLGTIQLGYVDSSSAFQALGTLGYEQQGFYANTAGIQAFPVTDAQLTALETSIVAVAQNGTVVARENFDGLYLRADQFTFRMEPGDTIEADLWATKLGEPLANAKVVNALDPSGLQAGGSGLPDGLGPTPAYGTPTDIIEFSKSLMTDAEGRATLAIKAGDPQNPRGYVDGQVYGVRYLLADIYQHLKEDPSFGMNPADFVSLLVHDTFEAPEHPTWYDLQPIWQQYANLYPIMDRLIDLGSYEQVAANADILELVFGLPMEDPNSMPVTRDLSAGKRDAILRWLAWRPEGVPLRGEAPVKETPFRAAAFALRAAKAPAQPQQVRGGADPRDGGKTFAMSQRPPRRLPDFDVE